MTDQRKTELQKRYHVAAHAMQAGVAMSHSRGGQDGTPKHLRVGVNSALVNDAALAKLLMDKGIITEEEYLVAVVEAMEVEAERYRKELSDALGAAVTLV